MRLRSSLAVACAFAATFAGSGAQGQRVLLRGQVVDEESGQPLRSAVVEMQPHRRTAVTDAEGRFALRVRTDDQAVVIDAMGYEMAVSPVELRGDTTDVRIALKRDPVRLQGIVATVNRLESRRRAYGFSVRALNTDQIALSGAPDAWTLVRERMGLFVTSCGHGAGGRLGFSSFDTQPCVYVRGSGVPLRVYVDETRMPDASVLSLYSPAELAAVEFYPSSAQVRVYTRWFIEWAATRDYRPLPLSVAL